MLVVILLYDQLSFRPLVAWMDRFRVEQDPGLEAPRSWVLAVLRHSQLAGAARSAVRAMFRWSARRRAVPAQRATAEPRRARRGGLLALVLVLAALAFALRHIFAILIEETSLAVYGIVAWHLDANVWLSPLMILGTQWYILFNVIVGAAAMPSELRYAADNLHVGGWLWWRKVALPGVFPYYVTGVITASGGSWNASIVAEVATWGDMKLEARGLGAYIADATAAGDLHRVALGIATMCLFVVVINRVLWRPLYDYAERKFRLS
jgi:NitT/TauT family transport system permease protein